MVIKLGESLISWKTKKQATACRSSADSVYRAMALTTCRSFGLERLLQDIGFSEKQPTALFCDNKAATHIAANPMFHERTKHIEIYCNLIREKLQQGIKRHNKFIHSSKWQIYSQRH